MDNYVSFLITICFDNRLLIKIALKINRKLIDPNVIVYPNEREHKEILHNLLPDHIKKYGPIVKVEQIKDIIYINGE